MTGKIEYQAEGQVLRITTEGSYSVDYFLSALEKALGSTKAAEVALMVDSRQASIERTEDDLKRITEAFVAHADRIRCLAYVTLSDTLFDIVDEATSFAEFNKLGNVKPFRDLRSAEIWIAEQLDD